MLPFTCMNNPVILTFWNRLSRAMKNNETPSSAKKRRSVARPLMTGDLLHILDYLIRNGNLSVFLRAMDVPRATASKGSLDTWNRMLIFS
ncbi:hypothetical protein SDC9_122969 [bioreactor metagenome]|uniref:Uncharacterized protein n=1 Tax=bioreactor metagenome TaxID=1076179 RepID=A0A645CGC0_9ZZZZ